MKTKTIELYPNSGDLIEIKKVISVTVFDIKGFVKIKFKEGGKIRIIETNMQFVYYDGVEDEK